MNATVEGTVLSKDKAPRARKPEVAPDPAAAPLVAVVPQAPTPMSMLDVAVRRGATIEELKQLMDLQDRHERNEARKAFVVAFCNFKAEAVTVIKNKDVTDGPLKGKSYAELFSVVNAVTPALSKHGLGAAWKLTKDERDWIEITCTITHTLGHSESVSMGGPPDTGGAKSPIQARASTTSYLERYTLKAVCGVAEQGEDDDGAGARNGTNGEQQRQPEGKPPYPNEKITKEGLATWRALVADGKKTPDQIIATVQVKYTLSAEQEKRIREAIKELK